MNNANAETRLNKCKEKLNRMKTIIEGVGSLSHFAPFFNEYAAVIASGAIEQAFKTIIADAFLTNPSPQLIKYIDRKIRESSMNPSLENIYSTLKSFDENWNDQFKSQLSTHPKSGEIKDSFKSLVNARNTIAHGNDSTATLENVITYYENAIHAIEIIDNIVQ